jgi:hypothetical protein
MELGYKIGKVVGSFSCCRQRAARTATSSPQSFVIAFDSPRVSAKGKFH